MKRINPALALFVIAPVFGELFSGSSPLNEFINPITFITLALLYGCGAIIARELVIRWNKGWPSLLLLGLAYGIYEEGIMVQSFFDPTWMDLGTLAVYGRVAGVNWVWAEHLTIYHALISIAASIAFVEMLYPERRDERWIKSRTWWILNWAGFTGIYLVWELFTHYESGWWRLASWLAVFALAGLARVAPAHALPPRHRAVPRPWRFWLIGFLGLFGQFFIVYLGADNGAYPYPVAMLLLALWYLFLLWLVLRWSGNGASWDDRHRIALVNGALSLLLALGPLTAGEQYPVMYFSNPVFLLLLWLAGREIRQRVTGMGEAAPFYLLIAFLSALSGLTGCTASIPVYGAPVALTTSVEFPVEALLVPTGSYSDHGISRYALDTGKVTWRIKLEGLESLIDAKVAFDDARVYIASPGYIRAYAQDDGTLVWETPFEEALESSCTHCFATIAGRVLVQSDVGCIYGLRADTGEVVWRIKQGRAESDALGFYTPPQDAGNALMAFISRAEDDNQAPGTLHLVNVEDGSEARQIEAACTADAFFGPQTSDPGAFIRFDRHGETVYLIFSVFPDATCAQAWDVQKASLLWQTLIPEETLHHTFFWQSDRAPVILHRDAVYVGKDGGPRGNGLTRIDLTTGEVYPVLEAYAEYRYVLPLALQEGVLVAFVQYQGSDQVFEMWGVDVTTGHRLWSYPTEVTSANHFTLPYDLWGANNAVAHVTASGVVILEKHMPENYDAFQLHVRLLDIATGESLHKVERRFDYIALRGLPVAIGDNVYFAADMGLYRFDTTSGKLKRVLGSETSSD